MHRYALLFLLAAAAAPLRAQTPIDAHVRPLGSRVMPSFATRAELRAWLRDLLERRAREARARQAFAPSAMGAMADMAGAPAAAEATGTASETITNNQHAGVDEGGIVKLRGNHFVVLRRGRLFTVNIAGTNLAPVAAVDAFGPGIDPSDAWYDEMLISGDKVAVIGYSYGRGGTEVGIFQLGETGTLRHVSTFHLRSNDYYSSRNYAARLVGTKLVFYAPLYLPWGETDDVDGILPAFRPWRGQQGEQGFQTIVRPERVFRPVGIEPREVEAMHTVTSCDLAAAEVTCEATAVMGPAGRVFYVSSGSVYVWMASWRGRNDGNGSMLVRIPLGRGTPTAMRVAGSPVDQFSFLESDDGHLNVLTRAESDGEAMWGAERSAGAAALLRLPLDRMGDGSATAATRWYRPLATPPGMHEFHNRFVGDYLLYGLGNGWGSPARTDTTLHVVPWRDRGAATTLALTHGIDRIEVLSGDAVVVGGQGNNLEFSGIRLRDGRPAVAQRFVMPDAAQGELRSHGFFYKPDGEATGVLGLPVRAGRSAGYRHLVEGSASIVFLRNTGRRFAELGALESGPSRNINDGCRASCVDWYGNARPIFARGRIFALLGYELVEGAVEDGAMREVRRTSFAPPLVAMRTQH